MRNLRYLLTAVFLVLPISTTAVPAGFGQEVKSESANQSELEAALGFEAMPSAGTMSGGWGGGPPGTIFADEKLVHGGHHSARLERNSESSGNFSSIVKSIPMNFSGTTLELKGFLRTEDVSGFVGLWMREDGDTPTLAFDNMEKHQLNGTTEWAEYSITLPVHPQAKQLFFGVLLAGTGKAWADDLQLLLNGKPLWQASKVERPQTAIDTDHEFDRGSGISIAELSNSQVDNLVTLGKVWGFLKYYHPKITSGQIHWDYALFRVLPTVLAAKDHAAANAVLLSWVNSLGPIARCSPCAKLNNSDLDFGPDLDWISNEALLGADLSKALLSIRDNRSPDRQFYVSKAPMIGNPVFDHEPSYADLKLPDAGFQLLSVYRFWNIVEYWSPYCNVLGENWNAILAEFISRVALAKSVLSYKQEMLALVAAAHDGHANVWNALDARPPMGDCELPVHVRFVEDVPVVTGFAPLPSGSSMEIKIGDVITQLDGRPVSKLIESWKQYYAGSNDTARMRDVARSMTRGSCGDSKITVRRDDQQITVNVKRVVPYPPAVTHDLPGPAFRLLSKDVAYLKLSSVKVAEAATYVKQSAGTKGLIIDIRNYPSEFVVFALGSLLVDSATPFVRFTGGDLSNPGAFHWTQPLLLSPQQPHYHGRVVVLVDETSLSQAEYTSMAFRGAGAVIVGSTTSGADGNVSPFGLPGGLRTMISGLGVYYPDKQPTQRIGIVPGVDVKPTIAGIRAGRDEVLEQALREILGSQVTEDEIRTLAKPSPAAAGSH